MTRMRLGLLFGGRSGEHEVSLSSARSVLSVLDPQKFEVTQIGITHEGHWLTGPDALSSFEQGQYSQLTPVILLPEPGKHSLYRVHEQGSTTELEPLTNLDVVFPVLHGTFGEDGSVQGLLELAGLPYVGAGVTGSAVGMDKIIFKDVMTAHGIPVLPYQVFTRHDIAANMETVIEQAESLSSYPLFTKPVNLGSSVGITKCRGRGELYEGLMDAARYDRRVMVEQGLQKPREVEVSVLGNDQPKASLPGEVVPSDEFYSYNAKYIDESSQLLIPAPLPEPLREEIRSLAVRSYQAVDAAGMARVDFLLDRATDQVYVSEINTIPGFTRISMYPKLWEATGLSYSALVEELVKLALDRKAERDHTEYQYRRSE